MVGLRPTNTTCACAATSNASAPTARKNSAGADAPIAKAAVTPDMPVDLKATFYCDTMNIKLTYFIFFIIRYKNNDSTNPKII